MRSLRFKITLAFVTTSLLGVVLIAVLVRAATVRAFDTLVRSQQLTAFGERLTAYYTANSSWEGVQDFVRRPGGAPQQGMHGQGGPQQGGAPQMFGLADGNGMVILPVGQLDAGDQIPADMERNSTPVVVDGKEVGLLLNDRQRPQFTREEEIFRETISRAALWAAGGVSLLALAVSVVLASAITGPVSEMTAAVEEITAGKLEQQVPVRTDDELGALARSFNRMSDRLARATRAREQMTADIAHDLRTPLTVLSGHLEGLSDGVLKPTKERFELMYAETQQLLRMVQDLRMLSLADAGELKLYRHQTDICEILERAVQAHALQAVDGGISLDMACGDELHLLMVDPQRMAQVMDNLISNALRYTGSGGRITLSAGVSDGRMLISVSDTGKGIHPENLPYVFERFYRSDAARFQHGGESGLGLAIVKGIVEAHGGKVTVQSVFGEGTSFTISLPVS